MARNNLVIVTGDITSDIHYDTFTQNGKAVPFLRIYLMVNGTPDAGEIRGLRVVFYGHQAAVTEAHIKKGSRLHIEGHIQMRRAPNGNPTFEIVAESVEYIRNVDWDRGRKRIAELESGKTQENNSFTLTPPEFFDEPATL